MTRRTTRYQPELENNPKIRPRNPTPNILRPTQNLLVRVESVRFLGGLGPLLTPRIYVCHHSGQSLCQLRQGVLKTSLCHFTMTVYCNNNIIKLVLMSKLKCVLKANTRYLNLENCGQKKRKRETMRLIMVFFT